jgi:hypothetical protein
MTTSPDSARDLLRHALATLAYRASKVLRDTPPGFDGMSLSSGRTPVDVVRHMGDLMEWGERMARGESHWAPAGRMTWDAAIGRFFDGLGAFDRAVVDSSFAKFGAGVIFQGPVADALTHVGQIAMMRGLAGAPIRPESYARAAIRVGQVSRDQPPPGREFDGDASPRPATDPVDEASADSFPASDPPSRTPTMGSHVRPKNSSGS